MSNDALETRRSILQVIDEWTGAEALGTTEIARQLGLQTKDVDYHLRVLKDRGQIQLLNALNSTGELYVIGLTTQGEQLLREGPESSVMAQQVHIGNLGAWVGNMSGGAFQAAGSASYTSFSQVVNDPQALKVQVEELTAKMIEAVRDELDPVRLAAYSRSADELRDALVSGEADPSLVQRLLGTLAFLGDAEGAIGLTHRVWPMATALVALAAALGSR